MIPRIVLSRTLSLTPRLSSCSSRRRTHLPYNSPRPASRKTFSAGGATYYDSQSGLHVPTHNENEISAYLRLSAAADYEIPQWSDKNKSCAISGVAALVPWKEEETAKLLESSSTRVANDPGFIIFLHESHRHEHESANATIEYENENKDAVRERLGRHVKNGTPTTIAVLDPSCYSVVDPIEIANGVADIIDSTGGGDCVWIGRRQDEGGTAIDVDDVVRLCEELSYLDVTGPTMKSRLVVDLDLTENGELLEECMIMGVNKFAISSKSQFEKLHDAVKEHGKTLRRSPA